MEGNNNKIISPQIYVRNNIAYAIESGRLAPEDTLPSYEKTSLILDCDVADVRNAFKILVAEGYIKLCGSRYKVVGKKKIKTNVSEINIYEKRPSSNTRYDEDVKCTKTSSIRKYLIDSFNNGTEMLSTKMLMSKYKCGKSTVRYAIDNMVTDPTVDPELRKILKQRYKKRGNPKYTKRVKECKEPVVSTCIVNSPRRIFKKNVEFKVVNKVPNVFIEINSVGKDRYEVYVNGVTA